MWFGIWPGLPVSLLLGLPLVFSYLRSEEDVDWLTPYILALMLVGLSFRGMRVMFELLISSSNFD